MSHSRRIVDLAAVMALAGLTVHAQYANVESAVGINFVGTTGDAFPGIPFEPMQRAMGNGAAVGDYDGDGDLDVYLLGYEGFSNVLLRNDLDLGQAGFSDVTDEAGVGDLGLSRVAHFVDLDDDGLLDLLLVNDNDLAASHSPSRIYRNDGDGTFSDVTVGSGFEPLGYLRCGASLADFDLDGLLDIYVTAWTVHSMGVSGYPGENRLYRNLGNFVFQDVTDSVGLGGLALNSFTAIFHDFDDDDRPDIYVAIDASSDVFYWNTPTGFVDATLAVGTTHTANDMGVTCADFDLDGDLDLYSTNITGLNPSFSNCLYRNAFDTEGTTSFTNDALALGIEDSFWGWGVEFTDGDHDGDLDIFAVTGFDEFIAATQGTGHVLYQTPRVYFENTAGGVFSRQLGTDIDDSRALIAFDYDRDGDEDMLATTLNGPARLWENVGRNPGHWLQVAARQVNGNSYGIGVSVRATIGSVTQRREILAGESYLAGTPAEVHFGLGDATSVDELRIEWTDGTETVYTDVAADQFFTAVQSGTELYGCGVNPADSMTVISGDGALGSTLVLGVDNPLGTQTVGSLPFVQAALAPSLGFPCGLQIPGIGMAAPGAVGEVLIDLLGELPILAGPAWLGAGQPSEFVIPVPTYPGLAGKKVYLQGVMLDFVGNVNVGATEAVEVSVGN